MTNLSVVTRTDYFVKRTDVENGIVILPNIDIDKENQVYPVETYDFKKYCDLNINEFDVVIDNEECLEAYILHSDEIWLPVFYIAGQVGVGVLVGLIVEYIKYKFGSMNNDRIVHFKAVKKLPNGEMKEVSYDGPESGIMENFKEFDINKFMED